MENRMTQYTSQEAQDLARLKEALRRSDEEKFHFLMRLIKINRMLQNAEIRHPKK